MNVAKKPKRTFFTDFWRKVVALLLAVMVWVMVDMQMQVTSTVQQVKLKIRYDDSKFYLRRSEFDVDLEVATSAKLSQLSAEQFLLEVDFPESQLNHGGTSTEAFAQHCDQKAVGCPGDDSAADVDGAVWRNQKRQVRCYRRSPAIFRKDMNSPAPVIRPRWR